MTPAVPEKNGQFQPNTASSPKDCVASVTAMLVEHATFGRVRPTHVDIRNDVLAHGGGRDSQGNLRGLYQGEAADAAKRKYGVTLEVKLGQSRVTMRDTIGNGRKCGVSVLGAVYVDTVNATNEYEGPHQLFGAIHVIHRAGTICGCDKRVTYEHGEFWIEDPGTTVAGYRKWSADLIYRSAEARGGGRDKINLLVGPDTEGAQVVALQAFQVRSAPTYASGSRVGTMTKGARYTTVKTTNGQAWNRVNGTAATQWVQIRLPNGKVGYVKGLGLALV